MKTVRMIPTALRRRVACMGAAFALSAATAPAATNSLAALREFLTLPRGQFGFCLVLRSSGGVQPLSQRQATEQDARTWPGALPRVQNDPDRLVDIARLLENAGRTNEAQAAGKRALHICEMRLAGGSNEVISRVQYAEVLGLLKRAREQERVLADALRRAPNEWRDHAALAHYELSQAGELISPASGRMPASALGQDEQLRFESHRQRARERWTNAWAVADDSADAHYQYAHFLLGDRMLPLALAQRQKQHHDTNEFLALHLAPDVLAHWRKSLRGSKDPLAVAGVGYFNALAAAADEMKGPVTDVVLRVMEGNAPAGCRRAVLETLNRLEALASELPAESAAIALEYKAMFEFFFLSEEPAARQSGTRSLALMPQNDSVRMLLLGLNARNNDWTNALALARKRLEVADSAEWRFCAARALDALERSEEAEEQIRRARALDANYASARLASVAFAVRRATNLSGVVKAQMAMEDFDRVLEATRATADRQEWTAHWLTAQTYRIVLELLAEHTEHARKALAQLFAFQPDYEPGLKLEKLMKETKL